MLISCFIGATTQEVPRDDASAIVRRALIENKRDLNVLRDYIYMSDGAVNTFDNSNNIVKTSSRKVENFYLDGSPYKRIVQQDGKPLSEDQRTKQERYLDNQIKDTVSASPKHKEDRERKAYKALEEDNVIREDIANGFIFTIIAEEARGGDRCIKLSAEPKEGFKGKSSLRALLPFLHGSIWIDVDKGQWMDIDATPITKVGAGITYLSDQSAIHLHQELIRDNVWVITKEDFRLDARLFWDRKNVQVIKTYSDFKRFSSSVRVLAAEDGASGQTQSEKIPK
jgi:hypothetical protein